jgi:hypothetical protein
MGLLEPNGALTTTSTGPGVATGGLTNEHSVVVQFTSVASRPPNVTVVLPGT